jgi:hypothetical protein
VVARAWVPDPASGGVGRLVDPTSSGAWMGLAGLVDGLSGPHRRARWIFFLFFILLTEAGIQNASEKATINCDLWSEVVGLPASEKPLLPASVVVFL